MCICNNIRMDKKIKELKRIMREKDLSLSDVARQVGVHRAQVGRWLAEETEPSPMALKLLDMTLTSLKVEKKND